METPIGKLPSLIGELNPKGNGQSPHLNFTLMPSGFEDVVMVALPLDERKRVLFFMESTSSNGE